MTARPRAAVAGPRLLVVVLAAIVLVAACSTSSGTGAEPRVLRVLMTEDWVSDPFLDAVREFERSHPGVRIRIERGSINQMADAVRAGISSGDPPDVVQSHAYSSASLGLAQPLDDLWARHLTTGEFLPGAVDDVTWAGRRYGVPLDANAMALLYNAEHFAAAGLSPPGPHTTLEEFEQIARALTTPDGHRRGLAVPLSNWTTYGWVRAHGGEVATVGDDAMPRFTLDSPRAVDTLTFLARLVRDGVAFGPAPLDAVSADAYALFEAGRASMHTSGSWDLVRLRREAAGGRWGVALMPGAAAGGGTVIGGSSLWVPVGSDQRELAFEFMLHLTSDPYALRFAAEEGRLPVRPRLFDDEVFADPDLRAFLEQSQTASVPVINAFRDAIVAFEQALTDVLVHGAEPGAALGRAQARAVASHPPP